MSNFTFCRPGNIRLPMKHLSKIVIILTFLLLRNASATLWFEDGITGTVGNNLGAAAPYNPSSSQIKIAAGNLTYPNLSNPSPVGNEFTIAGASASSTFCTNNGSAATVGSVYYAFLAQCTTQPSASGNYVTDLHTTATIGSSDPADIYVKASGAGFVMGVRKNGGSTTYASSPTPLNLNTTYLVVLKYTFNPNAGDDTVTLYINPTPGSLESGATAEVSVTGGTDATGPLRYIGWKSQSTATGGAWIFDTIRVASTWVEAIPASTAPPSIINDLTDQAVSLGDTVTFSIDAGGTLPLSYQWYYNTNTVLTNATSSTLTLTNVQLSDAGGYSVVVSNSYGSTTSVVAQLTVSVMPPSIDADPQDQSALVGQDTSFSVQASGTAPLYYQWYFNNDTVLSDQTNSVLNLANVQLTDAGGYSVVVTNVSGTVTSAVAQLIVNIPVAPSIITQPADQANVLPGTTTTFSVQASGSDPLSYQWYYNTNTPLSNGTDANLTITNVQPANGGAYSVVVNNSSGSVTSSVAFLTVNTSPVAPVFNSQPVSLVVLAGSAASFTAVVGGTAPISFQWSKNGTPIPGATSSTLNLANVQTGDNGSYTLTATNSVGSANSSPAQLTVTATIPLVNSEYNLTGFGQYTTGGGLIPDTDPAYAKVTTPLQLANAVLAYNKNGGIKVIEIMNDLDLGWNEIGTAVQTLGSTPFSAHNPPQLHPRLLVTGVSKMDIKYKNGGLTIFSANGATIRHCTFNIKSTHNVIVRNLKFDEMWEWDEATKGNYDKNDWDYIDLANGGDVSNVWIDHCTFTKSYDGIVDMKAGSTGVTLSWCKYTGDDGATNPNSFVWQQINSLESNKTSYAFYNFLRNNGFSTTNIVAIIQGHDKTHLMGSNDKDPNNVNLWATFHHLWMKNCWDRAVPRLRAGNVHDFNNYVDDTDALAAKRFRDAVQRAMSLASSNTLQNTYHFNPPLNGSISTEGGAILVEKCVYIDCLYPLRNNQTAPSDPTYTGKILGSDMIYQMDSTTVRGNSTDPGSPLGPFQAPIIAFSWNPGSGAPGGQLPYTYTPDDPSQLQNIVTSPTAGAGASVLTWAKTNWLLTTYPATAPFVVSQPQGLTNTAGQSATFVVVAGGTGPMAYQWYFNTNTPVANATNSTLIINNIQTTSAGVYSVIVTNTAGSVLSTYASLAVVAATPAMPQVSGSVYANGTFSLTVNGDAGHNYIIQTSTNLTVWTSIFTNPMPALPFTWSDSSASNYNRQFYRIQAQ
jgi:pectate lyase